MNQGALAGESTSDDAATIQLVKLVDDLDQLILALKKMIPSVKPWQRQLLTQLDLADRQMQVLRMTVAMQKPDGDICDSAVQLGATCRQIGLVVQGSRADGLVRNAAKTLAQLGSALSKLMLREKAA